VQTIRELIRTRTPDEVIEDLGSGASYVAQIAPEVGEFLPDAREFAPSLDSEATRFTAFDATSSFIRAASDRLPILIVFDDLHAADIATIRMLEFFARGLRGARVLALGTYRSTEPGLDADISGALADLARAGRRLLLSGLSRNEVQELAAAHAPDTSPRLVERLHALTEGNPLFVDEVMRLLVAEGALASGALAAGRLPVPDGVRETIRRRLDPLAPEVVDALRTAAVIGPEFALEMLVQLVRADRTRLLGFLDEATEAGLVEELPGTPGRFRFAHAVIRETLYDELPAQSRVTLHAKIGEALVELYRGRPDVPHSELAYHFLQAAPAGDPTRAADYASRAGRDALESMAYEQAIELFGEALGALDLASDDPARRGPVLLAMGQAEMRAGRLDAGRATLKKTAYEARRAGDDELLAQAALASAPWGLATAMADEEGMIPLLEEALDRLPEADGALRARLLARLAAALYWTASPERRHALADEAIAMARRVDDHATLAFVLSDAHLATWDPDSPQRSLPWASEIYLLAERVGNTELAMAAHSWRISLLLESGDMATVDQEIQTFSENARRLHQQRAQGQAALHRCARAIIAGDFDNAEQILMESAEYAGRLQADQIFGMRVAALAFAMREVQGRLGELEGAVRQFADAQPAMPVWRCALMCVYLQTGRDPELRREYDHFAKDDFQSLPRDNLWLPAVSFLAQTCHHFGDRERAGKLRAMLEPYSGRNVITPDVAYFGPVDRFLALLAATQGDEEQAAAWFASARRLAESMGAAPTLARLAAEEAQALGGAERPAAVEPVELEAPVRRSLRRRGDMWEVTSGAVRFHLKDAKGVQHLACLLANPGKEFHALDLVGVSLPAPAAAGLPAQDLSVRSRGQDDAGPLLDPQAKAEYKQRVSDLHEELEEAEAFNDPERASRARAELDFIEAELSAAVGLGGRDRRMGGSAERARVNVTRALKGTVDRVAEYDEALGHHLRTCVRTGMFCVYDPGPGSYPWDIEPTS
jgi:tetratricopeptide (TPR) repeat protein